MVGTFKWDCAVEKHRRLEVVAFEAERLCKACCTENNDFIQAHSLTPERITEMKKAFEKLVDISPR